MEYTKDCSFVKNAAKADPSQDGASARLIACIFDNTVSIRQAERDIKSYRDSLEKEQNI